MASRGAAPEFATWSFFVLYQPEKVRSTDDAAWQLDARLRAGRIITCNASCGCLRPELAKALAGPPLLWRLPQHLCQD